MAATFKEIFVNEDMNTNHIILYREGTFLKAHCHSAYLFCRDINPKIKVSCRFIQKENREDYSLGFPEAAKGKWLHGVTYREDLAENLIVIETKNPLTEPEYYSWIDYVKALDAGKDIITRFTSLITKQPVWKGAFDVTMRLADICGSANRRYHVISDRVMGLSLDLLLRVRHFYEAGDRVAAGREIQRMCSDLASQVYILEQKKSCSVDAFCEVCEHLESIRAQIGRLSKKNTENHTAGSASYGAESAGLY